MRSQLVISLLGGETVVGKKVNSRMTVADAVARGLPEKSLEHIKEALGLSDVEIAAALGVSDKTIGRLRRAPASRLGLVESDRLYRVASVFALARDVFEGAEPARRWLRAPQIGLGNRVPLDLMRTEAGAREIEDLLGRIEHGVFS